jgi:hypothetical protein
MGRSLAKVVTDASVQEAAVLKSYDPRVTSEVASVGLGIAGGLGGGAGAGKAVDAVQRWGEREARRYLKLPHHVAVVVTTHDVRLFRWARRHPGEELVRMAFGSFDAERVKTPVEVVVRIIAPTGKVALLSGPRGFWHPHVRRIVAALLAESSGSDPA